jgi:hypothetical protein
MIKYSKNKNVVETRGTKIGATKSPLGQTSVLPRTEKSVSVTEL